MKRGLLILILLLSTISFIKAQNCPQVLRQARTLYDEGQIQRLPVLLQSCIDNGFTEEERTEAYRLLVLAYLYLDEPEKADETMLALLNDNPQFQINEDADPAELINLYKTFRTDPIFLWGLQLNVNYTFVNVLQAYGLHNLTETNGEYSPNVGIGGSAIVEKILLKRVTGRFEASFGTNKFTYNNNFLNENNELSGIATPEAIETQTWLGASVLGQYKLFEESQWNPYVTLGPTVNYLWSSKLSGETAVADGEQAAGPSLDLKKEKDMRRSINLMISAGAGIKKKIGKQYFIANVRYSYGLTNLTKKHYDNELSLYYGMALNDITTSIASVSVGLLFQKFSPKKLTE